MTFFANSGIQFPDLEERTRSAGTESLKGGAELLDVISILESEGERKRDRGQIDRISKSFVVASKTYEELSRSVGDRLLARPTDAEFALAYGSRLWSYYWGDRRAPGVSELYRDLSIRLAHLASSVTDINMEKSSRELVPLVFRIWNDWEETSSLARLISLLNRR